MAPRKLEQMLTYDSDVGPHYSVFFTLPWISTPPVAFFINQDCNVQTHMHGVNVKGRVVSDDELTRDLPCGLLHRKSPRPSQQEPAKPMKRRVVVCAHLGVVLTQQVQQLPRTLLPVPEASAVLAQGLDGDLQGASTCWAPNSRVLVGSAACQTTE